MALPSSLLSVATPPTRVKALTNPNPSSPLSGKSLRSLSIPLSKHLFFGFRIRCSYSGAPLSSSSAFDYEHGQVLHPRPADIPWNRDLCNSVHLIGIVGTPVQIKHLSSGKAVAWSRLGVWKSSTDTTWINLTFWDELAHIAFQHVEKGQQIYVHGRLVSDTVEEDDEKRQTYYKVVVQQLNFVERTPSPVSLYEPETNFMTSGGKAGNFSQNHGGSTEELWQAFFANPMDWWDNRNSKRNPKYPDFKHKHTGEALWVEGKYNPPWVKSQLAILDSRMESLHSNEANKPVGFLLGDDFAPF